MSKWPRFEGSIGILPVLAFVACLAIGSAALNAQESPASEAPEQVQPASEVTAQATDSEAPQRGSCRNRQGDAEGAGETGPCERCRQAQGKGHGKQERLRQGGNAGGGGPNQERMENIRELLSTHGSLLREVEELSNGVRTRTTTQDPEVLQVLLKHVGQMSELIDKGDRIRHWDPLFSEITMQHEAIDLEIQVIESGIEVLETSDDPEVAKLIKAHARKISQFVEKGWEAHDETTPLPDGYVRPTASD